MPPQDVRPPVPVVVARPHDVVRRLHRPHVRLRLHRAPVHRPQIQHSRRRVPPEHVGLPVPGLVAQAADLPAGLGNGFHIELCRALRPVHRPQPHVPLRGMAPEDVAPPVAVEVGRGRHTHVRERGLEHVERAGRAAGAVVHQREHVDVAPVRRCQFVRVDDKRGLSAVGDRSAKSGVDGVSNRAARDADLAVFVDDHVDRRAVRDRQHRAAAVDQRDGHRVAVVDP